MKLSLPPKLVEKLVWVPFILFCKFSFPVKRLMAYYAETSRSRPLNHVALPITLLGIRFFYFQSCGIEELMNFSKNLAKF
jgi:hypothetical protein